MRLTTKYSFANYRFGLKTASFCYSFNKIFCCSFNKIVFYIHRDIHIFFVEVNHHLVWQYLKKVSVFVKTVNGSWTRHTSSDKYTSCVRVKTLAFLVLSTRCCLSICASSRSAVKISLQ